MAGAELVRVNRRCKSVRSNGAQCEKYAIKGGDVCNTHGGSAPQVKAKAAERVLRAQLQADVQALGWEPVTNPALLLADVAGEMVAFKDLAREQVNELRTWESHNKLGSEVVKARVTVYAQALRDVAATADKMWSRGIDSDMLRIERERPSREQAAAIQRVLERVIALLAPQVPLDERNAAVVASLRAEGLV